MGNIISSVFNCMGSTASDVVQIETGKPQQAPTTIVEDVKDVLNATNDTIQVINNIKKDGIKTELNIISNT